MRKQFKYFKYNETIYTKWFVFGIRLEWILFGIHSFLNANIINTRSGKEYQISTIRDILTNPVYCVADQATSDYFEQLGCQVCIEENELDGIHGIIGYGKLPQQNIKKTVRTYRMDYCSGKT